MGDDIAGGCLVVFVVVVAIGIAVAAKNDGWARGITEGRCAERWRYQHTITDTLATVRSGCTLPITEKK